MSLPDGTHLRVVGGHPTAEEIAAVVAALHLGGGAPRQAPPGPVPPRPDGGSALGAQVPAWLRAARREACGGPPVTCPGDLRQRDQA